MAPTTSSPPLSSPAPSSHPRRLYEAEHTPHPPRRQVEVGARRADRRLPQTGRGGRHLRSNNRAIAALTYGWTLDHPDETDEYLANLRRFPPSARRAHRGLFLAAALWQKPSEPSSREEGTSTSRSVVWATSVGDGHDACATRRSRSAPRLDGELVVLVDGKTVAFEARREQTDGFWMRWTESLPSWADRVEERARVGDVILSVCSTKRGSVLHAAAGRRRRRKTDIAARESAPELAKTVRSRACVASRGGCACASRHTLRQRRRRRAWRARPILAFWNDAMQNRGWCCLETGVSGEAIDCAQAYKVPTPCAKRLPPKIIEIDGDGPREADADEVGGSLAVAAAARRCHVRASIPAKFTGKGDDKVVVGLYLDYIVKLCATR